MSNLNRVKAVNALATAPSPPPLPARPVDISFYAEDVFNTDVMREYLPKSVSEKLLATITRGQPLDPAIAGDVAHAIKHWALDRGATHFTHWFQPLTGATAEKHDAFLEPKGAKAIMAFSGKNLIVGEPDASSFPSGGLRSTFEARGYTAWDPTSPAFIKRHANGATLCIPTAFCSYTGEALDRKTPLLRSMQALTRSTKHLMKCFGLPDAPVRITLGAEQEYFLIDKRFYHLRPDLIQTGRTLFGAPPPKHQQLDDHYFGSIKQRILNFMTDVEHELWRLGIPAKTRHNEAAPAQFELAPIFEDLNLACDHNMVIMETLRQVSDRHGLVCLLHEKPFAGVNGSGKHNNWSVDYGKTNLLNPGTDPEQNAIFLTVLTAIIRAVHLHADLLRASVNGAGNDHRLGAAEAPPAIISIFLGDQLTDIIDQLEKGSPASCRKPGSLRIGADTLPPLPRDATDRNRTSPFAFTGNKFEFRAPGSSQSCSPPNVVLNTIIAESFDHFADALEKLPKKDFNAGLQQLLQKTIKAHKHIIFNGDGYTDAWLKEARRRRLPNLPATMDALRCLTLPENTALYEKYGVYSARELQSRHDIYLHDYHRRIRIEGEIALEIATSLILPAATAEYGTLAAALHSAQQAGLLSGLQPLADTAEDLGEKLSALRQKSDALRTALGGLHEDIIAATADLRTIVDALEQTVSDQYWPLPKYREMLFLY